MFCLAGIGGRLSGFVQSAKNVPVIEKNKNFNLKRSDIDRVKAAVKRVVGETSPADVALSAGECGCKSC